MTNEMIENILNEIKSKKQDSIAFSKKYQSRDMEELFQYYEGAKWAFEYAIKIINEKSNAESND